MKSELEKCMGAQNKEMVVGNTLKHTCTSLVSGG